MNIMGQSSSAGSGLNQDIALVHKKVSAQMKILNRLAFLRHQELIAIIEELNTIMRSFIDRNGKLLCFTIRKGSDSTLFWKTTIRIWCSKVNAENNYILSCRLLTLRQFIILYKEIQDQVAMLSLDEDHLPTGKSDEQEAKDQFTASAFFPSDEVCGPDRECCVCMDRKACLMLSCCHEFCEVCIDNWTKDLQHRTCPLCRSKLSGADDTWVLADKNEENNFENEVKGYLVSFADRDRE